MLLPTAGREKDKSCSERQGTCQWRRKMLKGQCNNIVHHFLNPQLPQLPQLPVFVSAAAFAATCWAVACVSASAWEQICIGSNSWLWLRDVSSWRGIVGIGMGHIQIKSTNRHRFNTGGWTSTITKHQDALLSCFSTPWSMRWQAVNYVGKGSKESSKILSIPHVIHIYSIYELRWCWTNPAKVCKNKFMVGTR